MTHNGINGDAHKWSGEYLNAARSRKDPFADKFVAELAKGKSGKELFTIMQFLLNEFVWLDHEKLDEPTAAYIKEASKLPSWADKDLIKKGEKFFCMHGPEIALMLFLKSLPSTYCCAKGAEVVYASGRLTEHSGNLKPFTRRLLQTGKFVINVLSGEGLPNDGVGVRAAVKIRTLHAFIRYFLKWQQWDTEKYDEPINQEDCAGTMLSFSVFVVEGLEQLGINVSKEEKDAYFHIWRVIGHLLGVEDGLLANDYDDAQKLGHAILEQQKGSSEAGTALTKACLDYMYESMPFKFLSFIPTNFMYKLMGEELSNLVGIKKSNNILVQGIVFCIRIFVKIIEWMKHHIRIIGWLAIKLNPIMLDFMIRRMLKDLGVPFTPTIIQSKVVSQVRKER